MAKSRVRKRTPEQRQAHALKEAARRATHAQIERTAKINRDRMAEVLNESLAPAVMRNAVTAPDGRVIVGPRVHIVAGRAVRGADPALSYGEAQMRAARRIKADWDAVGAGVNVPAIDMTRCGSGGQGGGHAALLAQVQTRQKLEAAFAHLGAFVPVVRRVILDCVPLVAWAREAKREPSEAMALLGNALRRLAGFYSVMDGDKPSGPKPIRTIGPARESYDMDVDGATETCHA